MLDLFCRRQIAPAGWKLGGSWHAWERDNAAVLSAYAELALSLERGACHRSAMWPAGDAVASTRARGFSSPVSSPYLGAPGCPGPFSQHRLARGRGCVWKLVRLPQPCAGPQPPPTCPDFPRTGCSNSQSRLACNRADAGGCLGACTACANFCAPLTLPDPLAASRTRACEEPGRVPFETLGEPTLYDRFGDWTVLAMLLAAVGLGLGANER